jgi:hypothetical protein
MLLEKVANYIRIYVGEFWSKPLFDCLPCMASVWGLIGWLYFVTDFWSKPLFDCPPCMASVWGLIGWLYFVTDFHLIPYLLILCGLNALTSKMFYYGD